MKAQRELGRRGVKAQVRALLESVGGTVHNLSEGKPRWKRPAGLPDLLVFLPRVRRVLFIETKTPRGRVSDAQSAFALSCAQCGISHVIGGEPEVRAYLQRIGVLKEGAG